MIGNVQEKTIKQYNASNSEVRWGEGGGGDTLESPQVVLYSYGVGFVYLFFLVAGEENARGVVCF